MKISVLANLYHKKTLEELLGILTSIGVNCVEIGAGGYPGTEYCQPQELLADTEKLNDFVNTFKKFNTEICALACHGNPIHPDKETAAAYDKQFREAILLSEKLGIDTVIGFSGCPGDSDNSLYPNWVTCPWPTDFMRILEWQWEEKLIPYWCETAKFAYEHGVTHIALEMHPGFCVYNPETLLRLRAAVSEKCGADIGSVIGANLDPSHLIWQGINPSMAARALKGCIHHVHAKDTKIDKHNTSINGVLDNKPYGNEIERSWIFRTVGYGNDYGFWKDFISTLRLSGYDKVLSIEHEDSIMTIDEGLKKAVDFLKEVNINQAKPSVLGWV